MPSFSSRSLIARLRASTRLVAWVLLVFVMKIGMVAACTVHDMEDLTQTAKTATTLVVIVADMDQDAGKGDPLGSNQHPGCSDCNCHHAAAMLPQALTLDYPPGRSEPTRFFLRVHHAVPRRELRPPIA